MCEDVDAQRKTSSVENLRLMYQQGSECCRAYSELTMKVRTLAQQVMLAYIVGVGLVITKGGDTLGWVLVLAGVVLFLFALVIKVLNLHYSSSFERIRDNSLIKVEEELLRGTSGLKGPWGTHGGVEYNKYKEPAWNLPWYVLVAVAGITFVSGVVVLFYTLGCS